jgi:hypothetical protein
MLKVFNEFKKMFSSEPPEKDGFNYFRIGIKNIVNTFFDIQNVDKAVAETVVLPTSFECEAKALGSSSTLELMESYEIGDDLHDVDELITNGEYELASDRIQTKLAAKGRTLMPLCRKMALLDCVPHDTKLTALFEEILEKEHSNVSFMSFLTRNYFKVQDYFAGLDLLSQLGSKLEEKLGALEKIRSFEYVFCRMLGDAWAHEDAETAQTCYDKILEKRGELYDVLFKKLLIFEVLNDIESQIKTLNRMAVKPFAAKYLFLSIIS